jgi:putative tryptophan/tyrosine transport system substrate-binding protein
MTGRLLPINIAALVLILGAFFLSTPAKGGGSSPGPIAILLSDSEAAYTRPVASFIDEIRMPVRIFNLRGDINNAPQQMAKIFAIRPSLIFALGAKAAYTAKVWTADQPEIPVIFAMVLNWQRYGLLEGQHNIAGIASEAAPGTQLASMTIAFPQIKRIGVIYSKAYSSETVGQAKKAAAKLGLEIVDMPIDRPAEFRQAFKQIAEKIDGFWLLADPVVYTLDNVDWLENRCALDRLICIGQSKNIAETGVLLAVDPDIANIGRQAASIAKSILLNHQQPDRIGVMPPLGTHLVLNIKTANKIGLKLSRTTVDMFSDIIEK